MKSVRRSARNTNYKFDYQRLEMLIFGDEEAARNYSENTSVSNERRKLIDRFVPTDFVARFLKAKARTAAARGKVDQLLRGELRPSRNSTSPSHDLKWALPESELREISAADVDPRYVLDAYARAAINEGRIEGQLWILTLQAHDRRKPKVGKKRGKYSKVAAAEATMTALLKDYFRRRPGHAALTDGAVRQRIEGDWDATFPNLPEKSGSTLRRLIKAVRDKHPEMRRSNAPSRRQTKN